MFQKIRKISFYIYIYIFLTILVYSVDNMIREVVLLPGSTVIATDNYASNGDNQLSFVKGSQTFLLLVFLFFLHYRLYNFSCPHKMNFFLSVKKLKRIGWAIILYLSFSFFPLFYFYFFPFFYLKLRPGIYKFY